MLSEQDCNTKVGILIINDSSDSDSEDDIDLVKANHKNVYSLSDEEDFNMVLKQNDFGDLKSNLSDLSPLSPFSPTMDVEIHTKKQRI